MNAGRALDAIIAEKVMGRDMTRPEGFKYPIGLPHYSTDSAAAWQVAEKLGLSLLCPPDRSGWCAGVITETEPQMFSVSITLDRPGFADTAPLAICLAALAAVGVEVPA